jgi:molybdopterin-guanine dinucleotide biosynthesis protein A
MYGDGNRAAGHSAGFVLAGGGSKRMGKDKALLPFGGTVLVAHVALSVLAAAGSVSLVGPLDAYSHLDFPVVPDLCPGFGPVGGIVTALSASGAEWNLIVACDMPGVSGEFLASLLAEAEDSGAECTIPLTPNGRLHGLCAVYRQAARLPLLGAMEAGTHKLHDAIKELNVHFYPVSAPELLANVNTPAQWRTFRNATH